MVDAIRRVQPLIKRACTRTGSIPVLTANQLKTNQMNLKRIKQAILVNLSDISEGLSWLLMLLLTLIVATTFTLIACLISYKVVIFLCVSFGIKI